VTSSSEIPLLYAYRARSRCSYYSSRGCISRILHDKSSGSQSMETFNLTAFVILLPTPQFGLQTKDCRRQRKSRPFRGLAQKEGVWSEHHCHGTKSHCAGGKLCEWDFDQRQLSAFLNTYSCFQNVFRTSLYKACTQTVDVSDRNESQSWIKPSAWVTITLVLRRLNGIKFTHAFVSLNISSPEVVHLLKLTHWQLIGCKTHSVNTF